MSAPVKNQLTRQQTFRLGMEAEKARGEIEGEKMNAQMMATLLAARVDFPVSRSNAKGIAKMCGITLHRRVARRVAAGNGGGKYLAVVRADLKRLQDEVAYLRGIVEEHLTGPAPQRWRMENGKAICNGTHA